MIASVVGLTKSELLRLSPYDLMTDWRRRAGIEEMRLLSEEEIIYIAKVLGAFWQYDYRVLKLGRPGLHAELKSGLHSDGFFVSRIMLEPINIRTIIAVQMALKFRGLAKQKPYAVAGVPDGATALARSVALCLKARHIELAKHTSGKIIFRRRINIPVGISPSLLIIEDFCIRGTGLKEAVGMISRRQPEFKILPLAMVIINMGDFREVDVERVGKFKIVPLAEHKIENWGAKECPLCRAGSTAIRPKVTDENWRLLVASQL